MISVAPDGVVGHWDALLEHFQTSPLAFYELVEQALQRREIPSTTNSRVDYKEGGILSAKREYLNVRRERIIFDVCGAPFGTGFFVSWWLAEARVSLNPLVKVAMLFGLLVFDLIVFLMGGLFWGPVWIVLLTGGGLLLASIMNSAEVDDIIGAIPLLGGWYLKLFRPPTYYRVDNMLMFQQAVHNAVLEVVDGLGKEKGFRALSELERKPVLKGLLG